MLKPMNCPHHAKSMHHKARSYRDLPLSLQNSAVYRWEQSGEISGMTRVRGFTQDDAHLFVTEEQIAQEVLGCIELVQIIFDKLGMTDYRVRVGLETLILQSMSVTQNVGTRLRKHVVMLLHHLELIGLKKKVKPHFMAQRLTL